MKVPPIQARPPDTEAGHHRIADGAIDPARAGHGPRQIRQPWAYAGGRVQPFFDGQRIADHGAASACCSSLACAGSELNSGTIQNSARTTTSPRRCSSAAARRAAGRSRWSDRARRTATVGEGRGAQRAARQAIHCATMASACRSRYRSARRHGEAVDRQQLRACRTGQPEQRRAHAVSAGGQPGSAAVPGSASNAARNGASAASASFSALPAAVSSSAATSRRSVRSLKLSSFGSPLAEPVGSASALAGRSAARRQSAASCAPLCDQPPQPCQQRLQAPGSHCPHGCCEIEQHRRRGVGRRTCGCHDGRAIVGTAFASGSGGSGTLEFARLVAKRFAAHQDDIDRLKAETSER